MQKIGIITVHWPLNYGAFLQAYCLQEFLRSLGFEAKIIDYRPPAIPIILGYQPSQITFVLSKLFHPAINGKKLYHYLQKSRRLRDNQRQYYLLSPCLQCLADCRSENFDAVIVGSDEIWNIHNPVFGYVPAFFGEGIPSRKIISYAPSFGSLKQPSDLPPNTIKNLRRLAHVSTRDKNSQNILNAINVKSIKALDPTFLYSIKLPESKISNKNYAAVYIDHRPQQKTVSMLLDLARINKCELIGTGYYQDWCHTNYFHLDAFAWLNRIKYSSLVITNTFHGTIFAIKYRRPLIVIEPGNKLNKVTDLLEDFHLLNHYARDNNSLTEIWHLNPDPVKIQNIENQLVNISKQYLHNALL